MATLLSLAQDVARESGTVPTIGQPETVTNQTGRLLRIVLWVRDAHMRLQRHHKWRWLHADFEGSTIAGVRSYDAAAMGITSRFSRWVYRDEEGCDLFTIHGTDQADEGYLSFVEWRDFRRHMMIGSAATETGRPNCISINDSDEIVLYPTPDDTYTIRGVYMRSPQDLTDDGDVPEMPEEYHEAIRWGALVLLGEFDEAREQVPGWAAKYYEIVDKMRDAQLPRITIAGPME